MHSPADMIRLYYLKKNFDVQKAERWMKERRIPMQTVDLSKAKLGMRELEAIASQTGLEPLIDSSSRAWQESPARFTSNRTQILEALCSAPACLRLPITRCNSHAAVGFVPELWEEWLKETSK